MKIAVIGAGLTGCTVARCLKDRGHNVKIFERGELGGNCRTEIKDGIEIHIHGPHIWHNDIPIVQHFVNRFVVFKNYHHTKYAINNGIFYQFPVTLEVFRNFEPGITPEEIERRKREAREDSFEDYLTDIFGKTIYEKFYREYSLKQWGTLDIPVEIAKRIPIRSNNDNNYFHDKFQALPSNYMAMFEHLVSGIEIIKADYIADREYIETRFDLIVYTGAIDELFGYDEGMLKYRTITHNHAVKDVNYYQPCATLNWTDDVPWVRTVEHKHFNNHNLDAKTHVTYEYVSDCKHGDNKYYPMWDNKLYETYRSRLPENVIPAGRLGRYKYLDMNIAVRDAILLARDI